MEPKKKDLPLLDLRFKTFFRILVTGPAGSGKTHWVRNFIKHRQQLMDVTPKKVIYYYRVWQESYAEMQNETPSIEFKSGIPSAEEIEELGIYREQGGTLLILDDQLDRVSQDMSNIFLVMSRHSGVNVIFLSQMIFPKNPYFRDISRNVSYMVIFKNARDQRSFSTLAQQIKSKGSKHLQDVFNKVTEKAHSYLLLDFH
jgi:hypothetical protein